MYVASQYSLSGTTAKSIASSVEQAVISGDLPPGAALPPVRALAEDLGVSPGTVATAYQGLRRRGIVVTRGRGGTIVAEAPPVASRRPPPIPAGLRDLASGQPDPALLPALAAPGPLTASAGAHRSTPRLAGLEDAARKWMTSDGVPASHLTFAHGALDLIGRLLSVELRPGDAVAMEDPGYHHLFDLLTALGLRAVPVTVDDEGMRPEALRSALRAGVRAVVCSPRGQNPYGGHFSAARRDALLDTLTSSPDVLVVENDHVAAVAGRPLHSLTTGGLSRWAHVRTVTKYLGPDLRWSAAACDATTLARHDGRFLLTSGWVSRLLQRATLDLLTDPDTRALVRRARQTYGERRQALITALDQHGITAHGDSGLNVWLPVRDESAMVNGLRSRGWWVAAGARFRFSAPPGVRITVASLPPADAHRLAADCAAVSDDAQPTYGG